MYYVMRASAPSLHRESTDSLIRFANMRAINLCVGDLAENTVVFSEIAYA